MAVNLWAPPELRQNALFYAAVVVSAWYGGLGPGLAAALACAAAQVALIVGPAVDVALIGPAEYLRGAVFLLAAALTGTLTESLRSERALARAATEEARLHERAVAEGALETRELTERLELTVEQLRLERESAFAAHAEAEAALERVITLQRVTVALSEAATPDRVADVVLTQGMEALDARSGILLAFAGDRESVQIVRAAGVDQEEVQRRLTANPVDSVRLVGALRHDELSLEEPTTGSVLPSASALRRALDAESLAMVPVAARERPLGVLAFDVSGRGGLASADNDLLMALGRQCAQALDRARLFANERSARAEAEHASRAKSQFLTLMSHELRTPLNAILGYEELLETEVSGPISAVQRQHLARIRESTRHLLSLIEQILSLSKAQAGREDVRIEEADAAALVQGAAAMVEPQLRKKEVALELDLPEGGMPVRTDARKVSQILLNVLSNAVKFTDRGVVRVSLRRDDAALEIAVSDTGRGIDERHREQVFEPFVQLPGDGVLPTGTGLGLAVARELARHLGGDITLESAPGKGSTFRVRIPYRPAGPDEEEGPPTVTTSHDGNGSHGPDATP